MSSLCSAVSNLGLGWDSQSCLGCLQILLVWITNFFLCYCLGFICQIKCWVNESKSPLRVQLYYAEINSDLFLISRVTKMDHDWYNKNNKNIEWGWEKISRVLIMIFCWSLNNTGMGILFQLFINFLWWNIGYVLNALWLLHSIYSYFYLFNIWLEVDYLNEKNEWI